MLYVESKIALLGFPFFNELIREKNSNLFICPKHLENELENFLSQKRVFVQIKDYHFFKTCEFLLKKYSFNFKNLFISCLGDRRNPLKYIAEFGAEFIFVNENINDFYCESLKIINLISKSANQPDDLIELLKQCDFITQ